MELNMMTFAYLFLRLAPFILACFFTLASLLNSDWKGVIYLAGLVLSTTIVSMCSSFTQMDIIKQYFTRPDNSPEICRLFTFGNEDISSLPLSQSMLTFTFVYLLYPLIKNKLSSNNIPTLLFFPILIAFDFLWNNKNSCYSVGQLVLSLLIGGTMGFIWALTISNGGKKMNNLYFTSLTDAETCSKPSKSTFKCNVYKNGKLISKNISG
jgi:hypothetical protein